MITGKTVYVLGAGASQHSGAPLLRDFLLGVRILRESNSTLRFKDSFDRVFEWIDGLRASSYYVEFDLDNLEHVFSLAEMSRQLGLNKGDEISTDLRRVIMETLDNTCRVRWYKPDFEPDHSYFRFALCLAELNAQRVKSANQLEGSLEKDAVITFNYDVMLDYAMQWHKMNPEYCLNSDASPTSFRLLKLHGSANWAICKTCSGKPPSVVKAYPMRPGENPPPDLVHGEYYPLRMVTHILSGLTCPHCHDPSKIESLIIPPTWSKTVAIRRLPRFGHRP